MHWILAFRVEPGKTVSRAHLLGDIEGQAGLMQTGTITAPTAGLQDPVVAMQDQAAGIHLDTQIMQALAQFRTIGRPLKARGQTLAVPAQTAGMQLE